MPETMEEQYASLLLCNQLCFPLYAAAKEIAARYKPVLGEIGLTYTQYLVMLVVWEHRTISVKEIGSKLYLDSGTLTPVLKKLEQKGMIIRKRDTEDERILNVSLTADGAALRERALRVPEQMRCSVNLTQDEKETLCRILQRLLQKHT